MAKFHFSTSCSSINHECCTDRIVTDKRQIFCDVNFLSKYHLTSTVGAIRQISSKLLEHFACSV